mgnify:CR=1 FL=1
MVFVFFFIREKQEIIISLNNRIDYLEHEIKLKELKREIDSKNIELYKIRKSEYDLNKTITDLQEKQATSIIN